MRFEVLSSQAMRDIEQAAISGGVASASLMETAGAKVADIAMRAWSQRPVAVICGPGNNGGDGFVAARVMANAGWPVKLCLIGGRAALRGDAKLMADLYAGDVLDSVDEALTGAGLIIDGIFGTGLSRDVEDASKTAIEAMNAAPAPVLSIDVPSGVNADSGQVMGVAIQAVRTVTFHSKKPAHILFPGRALSGAVDVVDIGIAAPGPGTTFENQPSVWGGAFVRPAWQTHKYHRGQVKVVSGGPLNTGAARLAAKAALRIGAGLVTVLASREAALVHAAHLSSVMINAVEDDASFTEQLNGSARGLLCVVIGPASGVGDETKSRVLSCLQSNALAVLDADALTSFANDASTLFDALRPDDVLTPHTGEFARLFEGMSPEQDKLTAAREASAKAGCVVVLKGPDTIITAPDGRAIINVNAPPDLATAGSGDVLAGFIAGLKAQGMPGFEAAAAAVWFHGACALSVGPGLIAEDLPRAVPAVLRSLLSPPQNQGSKTAPEQP